MQDLSERDVFSALLNSIVARLNLWILFLNIAYTIFVTEVLKTKEFDLEI